MAPIFLGSSDWVAAFWAKVSKDGPATYGGVPCWRWTAGTSVGYGSLTVAGKTERCHRLSWLLAHGDPGPLYVLHHCDNRLCVNPDHLFAGTHADNMRDAAAKGRLTIPRPDNAGQRNGRSKLTPAKVAAIRKMAAERPDLTQAEIGEPFGVGGTTVCRILKGLIWRGE